MTRTGRFAIRMLWLAALATTGCERPQRAGADASIEQNKAVVRRWIDEGFNNHNVNVVDEVFAERITVNGQVTDRAGLKQSMSRYISGFPDLHVTIANVVAEGSEVGIWYTVDGTQRGEFDGIPPTGKYVKWSGVDLLTLERGNISEALFLSDELGLLKQLRGTMIPPRTPEPQHF